MSNKEKEEVLRRLERNRVAFEGWLAKKREERTVSLIININSMTLKLINDRGGKVWSKVMERKEWNITTDVH